MANIDRFPVSGRGWFLLRFILSYYYSEEPIANIMGRDKTAFDPRTRC